MARQEACRRPPAEEGVQQIAARKGFLFSDRGDVALRGFEDPVRLFEVRWREEG